MYMIGQKGFPNIHSNPNEAVFSGAAPAASPAPQPMPAANNPGTIVNTPQKTKQPMDKKIIFIATLAALVGAGVAVGVVFLIRAIQNREATFHVDVYDATTISDGSTGVEETISHLDDQISAASNDEERFASTLTKVRYYIGEERYDEALEILQTVDSSGLDDYNLYRYYNHFVAIYQGKGDTASAARYEQMANDAQSRDSVNF